MKNSLYQIKKKNSAVNSKCNLCDFRTHSFDLPAQIGSRFVVHTPIFGLDCAMHLQHHGHLQTCCAVKVSHHRHNIH